MILFSLSLSCSVCKGIIIIIIITTMKMFEMIEPSEKWIKNTQQNKLILFYIIHTPHTRWNDIHTD